MLTSIFKDNPFIESPNTATELLLYSFLVFIRRQKEKQSECSGGDSQASRNPNHQNGQAPRKNNPKQWTLKMIAEDDDVIQLILSIAKYSYETLQRREIIFEASKDDQEMLYAIEKIGLVVKSTKRESGVTTYQFQHLTFQELFAAIHIHRMVQIDRELSASPALRACLTIVCGLEGICCNDKLDSTKPILQSMLKRLIKKDDYSYDSPIPAASSSTKVLDLLQTSWMSQWTIDPSQNKVAIDISDLFIEAFFESQYMMFPQHLSLAEGTSLVFTKEKQASPLTKYPLYRLCHFIHAFVHLHPTMTVKFFPLYSLSFGIEKLEVILHRCQTLYLNTKSLMQEETIHVLTFIYEELYQLQHFNELIINFGFSKLDQFLLDALASTLRFTRLESLHLQSIEIADKPRLRWPRMLALLQQSIKNHLSLKRLTLHKCGLTDEVMLDITPVFRYLTHIDVSGNGLSQVTLNRILCCQQISDGLAVECVNFSWNQFNHKLTTELSEVKPYDVMSNGGHFKVTKPEDSKSTGHQTFPLIKVLDISQCQTSPLNILEEILVINIIKTVRHLRVDRFIAINQFIDALHKVDETGEHFTDGHQTDNDNNTQIYADNHQQQRKDHHTGKSENGTKSVLKINEEIYQNTEQQNKYSSENNVRDIQFFPLQETTTQRQHKGDKEQCEDNQQVTSYTEESQINQTVDQCETTKPGGEEYQIKEDIRRRVAINLQSIYIKGFGDHDDDEQFKKFHREMKEQFENFGIEIKLFGDETADFLTIPDWFEISHDVI